MTYDLSSTPNLKRIVQSVTAFYSEFEDQLREYLKKSPVEPSCPSCTTPHCCSYLALTTFGEAMVIALTVLQKPDWRPLVIKLVGAAQSADYDGMNQLNYQQKKLACAFLVDNRCSVYAVRPNTCRTLTVIDPSDRCAAVNAHLPVRTVDLVNTELQASIAVHQAFAEAHPDFPIISGPIPLMVLYAMLWFIKHHGDYEDRQFMGVMVSMNSTLNDPVRWSDRHTKHLSDFMAAQRADPDYRTLLPSK